MHLDFNPPPTLQKFMVDDSLCRFVIGPLGSGKTTAMIMEVLRRSVEQEPDSKGVRPTRWAIVRNTLPQLKQTVLPDIQQFLSPLLRFKVAESTLYFDFPLDDGTRVKSEWLLIPLDSKEDTRRLLSLQLTGAWVSEFRECDYQIISAILGRVGRYPSRARVIPTWEGLMAESNPFAEGSAWYEHLEINLPTGWAFFRQPGGLSDEAENRENLPPNYYERLMEGHSEDWVDVHVHGKYGPDLSGTAVFGKVFNKKFHGKTRLESNPQLPLMIGCDFGRTPAALIGQIDPRGRLLIMDEVLGENVGVESFTSTMLRPKLMNGYPGQKAFIVGDPAGRQKSQQSEESIFDTLKRVGFHAVPAPTNNIDARLRAVEAIMMRSVDGGPVIMIDIDRCPTLIKALTHYYRYRRKKTGDMDDKPDKNHPWSDIVDALQYMCLSMNTNSVGKIMGTKRQKREHRPRFSSAAWT